MSAQITISYAPRKPAQYPVGSWHQKLPTKGATLRTVMADGRLHGQAELTRAVGHRFGAVFFCLHRSDEPLHYERIPDAEDDSIVFYRQCAPEDCVICRAPARRSLRAQIRMLEEQVRALMERNAELEARHG